MSVIRTSCRPAVPSDTFGPRDTLGSIDTREPGDQIDRAIRWDELDAVRMLGALAQPLRLRLFRELVGAGPIGLTPGVLCERLDVPPSTLSFHLRELMRAQLVLAVRQGRHLIYRPDIKRINALLDFLTAHCCAGEPCGQTARPACPAPDLSEG